MENYILIDNSDFLISRSAAQRVRVRLPVEISMKKLIAFFTSFTSHTVKLHRSALCET